MNIEEIGGDKTFTYVVDPNSGQMEHVDYENLSIYFYLSAQVPNRSVITTDGSANTLESGNELVEFITYTEQNGDKYLTTNFLNIGGLETNVEGFGVRSVNIKYGAEFTPDIEIEFYDTRGSAMYNTYEYKEGGVLFNNSPFSLFFRQPYPIFNLVVKGFYGKAVSYCLHLLNWKAEFDGDNASFIIKANFKGFTAAFLSNIYIDYVIAVTNLEEGKERVRALNSITLTEMLNRLSSISTLTQNFKDNNAQYKELLTYNSLIDILEQIQKKIGFSQKDFSGIFTESISSPDLSSKDIVFVRDVALLNANKYEQHITFINQITDLVSSYNRIINENVSIYRNLNNIKINSFLIKTPNESFTLTDDNLSKLEEVIQSNGDTFDFDTNINTTILKAKFGVPANQELNVITINYFSERKKVDALLDTVREKKKTIEEDVNSSLNSIFDENLSLDLSVREIIKILMNNVDAFLSVIYDYAYKAESYNEDRKNFFPKINRADIQKFDERVYPFPAVVNEDGEKAWLGKIVGEDNQFFPEVQLVNKILNSLIFSTNELEQIDFKANLIDNLSANTSIGGVPANPTDVNVNYYDFINFLNFNGQQIPDQLKSSIINKMVTFVDVSKYPSTGNSFNSELLNYYASLDAAFAFDITKDDKIKEIILNFDTNSFVSQLTDYYQNNLLSIRENSNNTVVIYKKPVGEYGTLIQSKDQTNDPTVSSIVDSTLRFSPTVTKLLNENKKQYKDYFNNIQPNFNTYFDEANFLITKDLTANVWDKETENNIKKQKLNSTRADNNTPALSFINGLEFIDGSKNELISIQALNDKFTNVLFKKIGRDLLFPIFNGADLSRTSYYTNLTDNYAKALLFLKTLNFKDEQVLVGTLTHSCLINVPYSYLLWIGGLIYRYNYYTNTGTDIFLSFARKSFRNSDIQKEYDFFDNIRDFSLFGEWFGESLLNDLQTLFINWVDNEYLANEVGGVEQAFINYRTIGKEITPLQQIIYEDAYNKLEKLLTKVEKLVIANSFITTQTVLNTSRIESYLNKWITSYKYYQTLTNPKEKKDAGLSSNLVNDENLKIAIYDSLKNLYDGWIGHGFKDGKAYLACKFNNEDKNLIDHFHFIDRTWNDIGDKAVLNPNKILLLTKERKFTLYQYIGRLIEDNHFLFFTMPTYVNYYDKEQVKQMFLPTPYLEDISVGPTFVFMYVGGSSKVLDISDSYYYNDGFDLKETSLSNIPKGFVQRRVPIDFENQPEESGKYNMAAFRVAFADQNQNIFKKISVGQQEHKNTLEYLTTVSDIFDKRGGTKRFYKGVDIYDQFASRSYDCTVTALGNMQIQPLQYFQLDNVPFFHGAYLIMHVNHAITPNEVQTTFKGYRMPRYVYPIIDTVTSYVNIPLNEVLDSEKLTTSYDLEGTLSNGFDNTVLNVELLNSVADSNRILFTINKNTTNYQFKLTPTLTSSSLQANINSLFKLNPPVRNFGLGRDLCYAWVKNALATIGVVQSPSSGLNAWDAFVGLDDIRMKYFDNSLKEKGWSNLDFKEAGVKNGSFIFGFYEGSQYKSTAYNVIKSYPTSNNKVNKLTEYKKKGVPKSLDFNPITHVGLYFNDTFYHLIQGKVYLDSTPSFYPIAHYNFLPDLENLVKKPA